MAAMSKRKHPTPRSLRTGQTIYQVGTVGFDRTIVTQITVGSKRAPEPPPECWIGTASPQFLAAILSDMPPWLKGYVFYSRRRAERFRKQLQAKLDAKYYRPPMDGRIQGYECEVLGVDEAGALHVSTVQYAEPREITVNINVEL